MVPPTIQSAAGQPATITIPFSHEMAIAAIDGRKVATTRSEPKGKIGDEFEIRDVRVNEPDGFHPNCWHSNVSARFRLLEIMAVDLETVRDLYFRLEGFDSPAAFEKTWRALHRGHFTTGKLYYMHIFGRVA